MADLFKTYKKLTTYNNLLLGEKNELKNRYYHIKAQNLPVNDAKTENTDKNLPVNKTHRIFLELLLENNRYTYDELTARIKKSEKLLEPICEL